MSSIAFNARNGLTVGTVVTPVLDASANLTVTSVASTTPIPVSSGGLGVGTITGILKGAGTSAVSAATAGADYVAPGVATIFTVKQSFPAGSASVSGSINIPTSSSGNTPVSGDLYGTSTGLQWQNGAGIKQIAYADGTNSSGTWSISISGLASTATTSTNIAGGLGGSLPYQTAANTTGMLGIGANGYILASTGTSISWVAPSGLSAGSSLTAANLLNGAAGQIPYQSGVSTTSFSAAGTSGQILVSGGTGAPTWTSTPSVSTLTSTVVTGTAPFTVTSTTPVANLSIGGNAATATSATTATSASNLLLGALGAMPYQTATGATSFVSGNSTTTKNFLTQTGTGTASAAPVWGTISQADVGGLTTTSVPLFRGINLASGTSANIINASETWNASGTVFTGILLNITNTASAAGSMLMDLQVSSSSKFSVDPSGNVIVGGNLTINGTTTTINSATITVDDVNIVLGAVTTPTDTTAIGGGITLLGATNKTIIWNNSTNGWESSENIQLASGKTFRINGVNVLSATTLGTSVVSSSLTSVGTLTSLSAGATTLASLGVTGATTLASLGVTGATTLASLNVTGNVGIGTATPAYTLQVNGSFAAVTKSFLIPHPTKKGLKLRYGSLEGPENGVYVRGRLKNKRTIELPEYWSKLVDEDSITVQLTPIGKHQKLFVEDVIGNVVYIKNSNKFDSSIDCFYIVFAERIDVEKLVTEF